MSISTLEIQPSTSIFNPQSMSDAALVDELKKYSSANLPTMTYRLIAEEMGRDANYVHDLVYRINKGRGISENTREQILSYLIRKKHFSSAGLPQNRDEQISFPASKVEPSYSLTSRREKLNALTDKQLKAQFSLFQKKHYRGKIEQMAEEFGASPSMLYYWFRKKWNLKPETRKRIIDFLDSKGHEPQNVEPDTPDTEVSSTVKDEYENMDHLQLREAFKAYKKRHQLTARKLVPIMGLKFTTIHNLPSGKNKGDMEKWLKKAVIKLLRSEHQPSPQVQKVLDEKVEETVTEVIAEKEKKNLPLPSIAYTFAGIINLNISEEKKEEILSFLQTKLL